ncbi:MAG TPA: hypothetical protein VHR66_12555 [Gemmataceae bacterium]|jgi:hypothetical protein|nr:hypothetical protein [Gemmataceae bacterium]
MSHPTDRRHFLCTAALGGLGLAGKLPLVSADDARLDPKVVRLDSEIEPLVRLIEETPRERLLEEVGGRVKKGLSYREALAALFLAGVRNVEPRPSVGFKFHAVLAVNAAHLASLASPDAERWLPIFWGLDNFKSAQAANIKDRAGWRMPPVKESSVPPARKARQALVDALEKWDAEAADVAVAGLVRTAGADEVSEVLWKYAPRDFRSIGHKIIFAANARRTLGAIGWQQHAEPVLRSLVYAMMATENKNPTGDNPVDRPGRVNRELAKTIRAEWLDGKADPAASLELLAAFRQATPDEASKACVALLNQSLSPQTIWDAIFGGAGELLMRRPGIVSLHALTTANAIRFAYETSADDETRRWLLLQAATFLTLFRGELAARKEKTDESRIDTLEPLMPKETGVKAIDEIFADVPKNNTTAARKVLGYLKTNPDPRPLTDAARRLVFQKGKDAHDYKFSSAVLEDYAHVSPEWRDRFLAASVFWLKGAGDADTSLVGRTREALKG